MPAGPRPGITAPPLDLSGLGSTRAGRAARFIEGLTVPSGKGAKKPFRLRRFQKAIIRRVLAPGVRTAVVAIPRGNGKSSLAAALGLWALVDGPEGAQVPIVAGVAERQAKICFNIARRMVELAPELQERIQIFQDRLYMPHHDATLFPLPADADALLGANPTFTLVDELGVIDAEVFEAMRLASGKRAESTLLAIGTPPREADSIMRTSAEHGRVGDDPTLALIEYAADPGTRVDDRKAWKQANPALGDFPLRGRDGHRGEDGPGEHVQAVPPGAVGRAAGRGVDARRVVGVVRVYKCCVLYGRGNAAPVRGRRVAEPEPRRRHVPLDVQEVEATIREACRRWNVLEVTADPCRWTRTLQVLQDERIPVSEFPQSPSRMTPATTGLYEAVTNHAVTHDGDQVLAQHVANAVLKADSRGTRIVKGHKDSRRRIDLAVASVMAHDRARYHASQPRAQIFVLDG
jgi:phage terminase large subunit-like protein